MIPILLIGALGLIVAGLKLVQLLRIRSRFEPPLTHLLGLLRSGRLEEAAGFAGRARRPIRRLLETCVTHRDLPREDLEEALNEAILVETPRLERHLAVLSVGAAVAPLLGLLGTVTGMIRTFGLISVFGTGDPRLLSAGISEALITTEAGLVVAIPLVLLHAFLARRVHTIAESLEASAIGFLNATRHEGPGEEAA
jgi:biopolymer transport protein ExbB